MDWNSWIAILQEELKLRNISTNIINKYWGHVRYEYKKDTLPRIVAEWLEEKCYTNQKESSDTIL